jgi:hypothetical protein
MPLIIVIVAIWGVTADRRYLKAGGKKTGTVEMILWSIPVVLFVAFMIVMMVANHEHADWNAVAHGLGGTFATTFPAYLCLYEARRLYVRQKHPLKRALTSVS